MNPRATAAAEFLQQHGWGDATPSHLAGDASQRSYKRLHRACGETAILMDAPPDAGESTEPFQRIAKHLRQTGLSAPEVLGAESGQGFLLIEDLGDAVFARLMAQDPSRQSALYRAAVEVLLHLHQRPSWPLPLCDAEWLAEMTAPAFEFYASDGDATAFNALLQEKGAALDDIPKVVILRDYHAENLLWLPERKGVQQVGLLDFQDALLGHPAYDLVSVLQDARRDVDPQIEAEMITHYLEHSALDAKEFRAAYALLGVQRNLRILGIFARLCKRDGKVGYVDLIPRVWGYLHRSLEHPQMTNLARSLKPLLPQPTPSFLKELKSQCAPSPNQP